MNYKQRQILKNTKKDNEKLKWSYAWGPHVTIESLCVYVCVCVYARVYVYFINNNAHCWLW